MRSSALSPLAGALLGLLHDEPRSGYALRKLFSTTPMGHFSDSPGSIYPALARLARAGLIAGTVENPRSLRPRQVFHVTAKGLMQLRAWLTAPVTPERVSDEFDFLLLRFVFMPQTIGRTATLAFLAELERELRRRLLALQAFHRAAGPPMPVAGRLGIRAGIEVCAAHARWARLAQIALRSGRGAQP